ncbi:hypothetical protein [Streptomyces sp. AM8-1-1]|uniref:hypothetical protein n=1 Tax=Streptomyces sp. AM8-1-1 TaxID=3075825 RepID=UPI0028C4B9A9|nr:hypothetical protein [Streptomyces sp. AM8-1-1]WNO70129.1 hypothetical protein RPQ07_00070 [Streptomyces sp. AM8-1-1]WNO76986.1 hypothetical protein RPQ07_37655 [Streptomyces sp. AM8-1-1]
MSTLNPVPARRREVVLRIALPNIPACTAVLGTGSVGAALVHGTVPAGSPLVGPLVVLALGAMAYDVGLRALPAASADRAAGRQRGPSRLE